MKLATLLLAALAAIPAHAAQLREQINSIYDKSVAQCAMFWGGDMGCVKAQFAANYRWEITRDQDRLVGMPGTPGPLPANVHPTPGAAITLPARTVGHAFAVIWRKAERITHRRVEPAREWRRKR